MAITIDKILGQPLMHSHSEDDLPAVPPVALVNTKANILATTPEAGQVGFATDTLELLIGYSGGWYLSPFAQVAEGAPPDIGVTQGSSRIGYGSDYISDKDLSNVRLLEFAGSPRNGAIRTAAGVFQVYLNDVWNDIVINLRLREDATGEIEHHPIGLNYWIEMMSGNSDLLAENGLPMIQQYTMSMGAYPRPLTIDGGAL